MLSHDSALPPARLLGDDSVRLDLAPDHVYFADHVVRGQAVLPGVVYLELAVAAARLLYPRFKPASLENCIWLRPLVARSASSCISVALVECGPAQLRFRILDGAVPLAEGTLSSVPEYPQPWFKAENIRLRVLAEAPVAIHHARIYEAFHGMGIVYGTLFRQVRYVHVHGNQAVAELGGDLSGGFCLAGLLDGAFQSGLAISIGSETRSLMPFSLGGITAHEQLRPGAEGRYCVVTEKTTPFRTNLAILTEDGRPLLTVRDLGVMASRL